MKLRKSPIIIIIIILGISLSYVTFSAFFSQPTRAKGLVGHWSLSDEDEVVGSELITDGGMESSAIGTNLGTPTSRAQSVEQVYRGTYSQKVVTDAASEGFYTAAVTSAGKIFRESAWVYLSSGSQVQIGNNWDGGVWEWSAVSVSTGSWQEVSRIDIGGTSQSTGIRSVGGAMTFYVDDFSVVEISTADLTPNENNGTIYGPTYTTDRNGQSNKAMDFNGSGDYINIDGVLAEIANDTQGTFSLWVKPDDGHPPSDPDTIFSLGQAAGSNFVEIRQDDTGTVDVLFYDSAVYDWFIVTDAAVFPDGATSWTHLVLVQDGVSPVLYVNGVIPAQTFTGDSLDKTEWMSAIPEVNAGRIGCYNYTGSGNQHFFNGSLQDIRIYDRALTQTEITELYESYNPSIKLGAKRKGLVGEWSLGEEDDLVGSEIYASANAMNIDNEANATTGFTNVHWDTLESSATRAYSGDYSMHFTAVGGIGHAYTPATVVVGKRYRISLYYYGTNLDDDTIFLFRAGTTSNGSATEAAYANEYEEVNDTWTKLTADFTPTATTMYVTIRGLGAGNDTDVYVDALTIKEIFAADLTPSGNNGTIMGSTTNEIYTTDRNGQSNKAMTFSGIDSYISMEGSNIVDSALFTYSAWLNLGASGEGSFLAFRQDNNYQLNFEIDENQQLVYRSFQSGCENNDPGANIGNADWPLNEWFLITFIMENDNAITVYKNGVLHSSYSIANCSRGDTNWYIGHPKGSGYPANSAMFNGSISNVKIYNRALSASEILDIYDDYNPVIKIGSLKKGLIGHWSMDDKDGKSTTVIANRVAGVGGDGTMTSMTFAGNETTDRHGQTRALDFDSTTDYLDLASTRVFGGSEEDTLAFWLKWDSYTAKMGIMCANSAGTTKNYLQRYWGSWRFENNDGDDALSLATGVETNDYTWHHYSMIFHNDKSVDMYVDGVIASTGSFVNSDAVYLRYIGPGYSVDDGSTYPRLNADVQDVRIYNRALTAAEVEMLYEQY